MDRSYHDDGKITRATAAKIETLLDHLCAFAVGAWMGRKRTHQGRSRGDILGAGRCRLLLSHLSLAES